jgi:hypothetical protein
MENVSRGFYGAFLQIGALPRSADNMKYYGKQLGKDGHAD